MNNLIILENGLIPVYKRENDQFVNARELYEFLKVQKDFSDWIKTQLDLVESEEGKTHTTLKGSANNGGGTKIDYILAIDTAKEICMIAGIAPRTNEETKKLSKQARQYFIEVEKKFNQQFITVNESSQNLQMVNQLVQIIANNALEINNLKQQFNKLCNNDLKVKVEATVASTELDDLTMTKFMGIKQAAKESGIAEYTLRQWCKQKKIRFNIAGNTKYILRTDWLEEDIEHMANENMKAQSLNNTYGTIRKINV